MEFRADLEWTILISKLKSLYQSGCCEIKRDIMSVRTWWGMVVWFGIEHMVRWTCRRTGSESEVSEHCVLVDIFTKHTRGFL